MLEQNMLVANCRVENVSGSMFDSLIDILRKELSIYQELKDFISFLLITLKERSKPLSVDT